MFYFTCNESKIYESFTFWNKLQEKNELFHDILIYRDAPELLAISTNIPMWLKGIVHPKMKILSSFIHPQVVPNLYEFLCSAEHKGRYSEECGKQSSSGAPLTSIVFFSYYGSQWKQPGYKLSSKYLPLCSAEQRNTYRFGTTWGCKWWQNFHFWVNYPFKTGFVVQGHVIYLVIF